MTEESARKRNLIIAWMLLLIGMVLAGDGLIQLMADNKARMGETSVGGLMMILSGVFFAVSRKKRKTPHVQPDAGEEE